MTSENRQMTLPRVRARTLGQVLTFALGAAFLAYLMSRFGSAKVWLDLKSIGWRLTVIVALEGLVSVASARVWWHMLPSQAKRGYFSRLLLVHLAGSALNHSTPGAQLGGEPVKAILVRERFPISVTTASLLSSKLAQALARILFV